jgi:AraC family L-rhamnose operon regulatory protein RhaS
MTVVYELKTHQRHSHLNFAFVDGDHQCDFATHRHDFSELFIVKEGSGDHSVGSHTYPLSKGDVFVIHGDIEHGFSNVDSLKVVNLMFDAQAPFFEHSALRLLPGYQALFNVEPKARQSLEYKAKLNLNEMQLAKVNHILQEISDEYFMANVGFEAMLNSLMRQLIVTLARLYQGADSHSPQLTLALSRALVYIERHFNDVSLNSDSIASAAFISKRQLERLFRQFLQTSPNQYLRNTQLKHATRLLKEDQQLSIVELSELCGFSDSNYFSKCFKLAYGVSPREYRKQ